MECNSSVVEATVRTANRYIQLQSGQHETFVYDIDILIGQKERMFANDARLAKVLCTLLGQ